LAVVLMLFCLVIGVVLGFLIGTRGRQIAAAVMSVPMALRHFSFKIPEGDTSVLGQQTNKDDGEDGDDNEREDGADEEDGLDLEALLQPVEADQALADHPDVTFNPVVTYKIKRSKEQARTAQRRAALLAEGMDPNEVDERMEIEQTSGGGGGGARQNPLALLVSVGARVEPTAGGSSQEHVQMMERRRLQRNVDAYLQKSEGVEKFRSDKTATTSGRDPVTGGRVKTAHDVARETYVHRFGGAQQTRLSANVKVAKHARVLYRRWKKVHGVEIEENHKERRAAGDGLLNTGEFGEEPLNAEGEDEVDGEDGGEEGEEGEEGEDEFHADDDLAA